MEKTILVAIDGSVYSANSLDYLARLFAADSSLRVHLLAVAPSGGAGKEWMFDVDPHRSPTAGSDQRTQKAGRHLREATERLQRGGFPADRILSSVRVATGGIAATIRDEAERGSYDSLVIGRRGLGAVGGMLFGSTSGDLVEKCQRVPLWIVDGSVTEHRFLLAVHCQPASLKAADHLGFILKDHPNAAICLYHSDSVFGKQSPARAEAFHAQWGREWCDRHLDIDNFLFYAHAQVLMDNGVSRQRITQLPVQMHLDVGSDLLRQARAHHCGTIVLGRRPRGGGAGQFKGVSDKAVKQAENLAVWLAG